MTGNRRRPAWGKLAAGGLLLVALALAWKFTPLADLLTRENAMQWARAARENRWAPIAVVLAYTPAAMLMFPRPFLTLLTIIAFGRWLGFAYSAAGIMVAAMATYFAGRAMRKRTVLRFAGEGFEEAAGVPIAGETAYRALHEVAQVKPGQTVLIHGAAGGVGSAGVQIAKAAGARVIGTASASNADFLRSLGAQQAIDYRTQKFEDVVGKVDVVFNTANKETNDRSIAVVREGGMLVSIVGMPDSIACGVAKIRCATPIRNGPTNAELLARVGELADAGKFKVHVDQVYSMEEAEKAWEKSRGGHARGKLIIRVSEGPTMKHQ